MKKILFLGAAPTQIPPIRYALDQGHYVITCDYLPSNPGHELAHESHNVSTTDQDAVLRLAGTLAIDGVVAYASDPAAPTAAYVSEVLGLPGNPYESVEILSRKDHFRDFLTSNGFNAPKSRSFYSVDAAREWLSGLQLPAFVKSVDSSGNKGMTVVRDQSEFDSAFEYALSYSREKKVVVEERIEKVGYQIDSDAFLVDGRLRFWLWADAHFDSECSPPFPIANSYPSTISDDVGQRAAEEVERLLGLLKFRSGAFNIEFCLDRDGGIWFLEIGPRNGGDRIPDTIKYATGVDLIKYTVDAAIGERCDSLKRAEPEGYWSNYVLHALASGFLEDIWVSPTVRPKIVSSQLWVKPGQPVVHAKGSDHTLGVLVLKYDSQEEMLSLLSDMNCHIRAIVRESPVVAHKQEALIASLPNSA